LFQKDNTQPIASYSLIVEEYIGERDEEASSQQQLSAENQARLRDIILLLNKDITTLVQDADQIRDIIELIDQEVPPNLRASLESIAHLDDHFATVKRASKSITVRATLQNDKLVKEQHVKELHSEIQSAKHSLETLEPELKVMEEEKTKLEAQLAQLNAKIQSHKAKVADLPGSIEAAKAKITSVIKENQQIKNRLIKIHSSEEDDQKVLDDVSRIRTEAMDVINLFLNE
jgi:chromosome segregation ATPase